MTEDVEHLQETLKTFSDENAELRANLEALVELYEPHSDCLIAEFKCDYRLNPNQSGCPCEIAQLAKAAAVGVKND